MDETPVFARRGPRRIEKHEIIRQAQWLIDSGYPHDAPWSIDRKHIPEIGRSPSALFRLICNRQEDGKRYLGHGSWDEFKQNELGIPKHAPDASLMRMNARQLLRHVEQMAQGKQANTRQAAEKTGAEKRKEAEALLSAHHAGTFSREHVLAYLLDDHHHIPRKTIGEMLGLPKVDAARRLIGTTRLHVRRAIRPKT